MKKYSIINLLLIVAVVLFASCAGNPGEKTNSGEAEETATEQENMQTILLAVEGMTCSGCEIAVVNSLTRIEGVSHADASHSQGTASVTFDPGTVNVNSLLQAIEGAGYQAVEVEIKDR